MPMRFRPYRASPNAYLSPWSEIYVSHASASSDIPKVDVSPANGAAIRFALGDGDKRENGDGFQSQSRFLEVQDLCVYRRSRISRQDAVEPGATEQSDPPRGGA